MVRVSARGWGLGLASVLRVEELWSGLGRGVMPIAALSYGGYEPMPSAVILCVRVWSISELRKLKTFNLICKLVSFIDNSN